ncbi:MAG: sulfatase [Myxococcota bacterium]|nr:sulfatase [Myxococcota bacterium]MDP7076092.1 sulfatase [Myxococcota bacterium]MDP7301081.1 sulfatase [Myxococcota bacterium]MDP7433896.1 sulfatase [Myxococcota bacterium]MDP7570286.1 sulfatase [Myxococcota bacterium]
MLLVSFDTTRADRIGAYGYDGADTPNIDALAREGIVFEQAIAPAPITLPSHATILTGQPPSVHGVHSNGNYVLSSEAELVSETLHDRGFRTGAFVSAFVLDARFGLDQGFESYRGPDPSKRVDRLPAAQWRAGTAVDEAIDWFGGIRPDESFFAWIHFFDPHQPYRPPKDFRSSARQIYDVEIAYADRELGRLLEFLDAQGRSPELTVVVTADHGEGLGEHGEVSYGILAYQGTLHVPLVISGARVRGAAGSRVRSLVGLVDVAPTLLTLAGVPSGESRSAGHSLVDAQGVPVAPPRDRVIQIETLLPYHVFGWSALRGLLWRN